MKREDKIILLFLAYCLTLVFWTFFVFNKYVFPEWVYISQLVGISAIFIGIALMVE